MTGQTHLCPQPASYLQVHRYLQAEEECSNRYERLSAGTPTPALKRFHVSLTGRSYGFPYKANMTATCSRNSSIPIYAYRRERNTSITFLLVKVLDHAFGVADGAWSTACETNLYGHRSSTLLELLNFRYIFNLQTSSTSALFLANLKAS